MFQHLELEDTNKLKEHELEYGDKWFTEKDHADLKELVDYNNFEDDFDKKDFMECEEA